MAIPLKPLICTINTFPYIFLLFNFQWYFVNVISSVVSLYLVKVYLFILFHIICFTQFPLFQPTTTVKDKHTELFSVVYQRINLLCLFTWTRVKHANQIFQILTSSKHNTSYSSSLCQDAEAGNHGQKYWRQNWLFLTCEWQWWTVGLCDPGFQRLSDELS